MCQHLLRQKLLLLFLLLQLLLQLLLLKGADTSQQHLLCQLGKTRQLGQSRAYGYKVRVQLSSKYLLTCDRCKTIHGDQVGSNRGRQGLVWVEGLGHHCATPCCMETMLEGHTHFFFFTNRNLRGCSGDGNYLWGWE